MAGYTRQSSFTDGDVITASHSNDEFNQILAAFVNTSGHKHDGTAAEGPVIGLIGDPGVATPLNKVVVDNTNNRVGVFVDAGGAGSTVEQVRFQDGAILPVTNNDVDLGSSGAKFKELHLAGAANIAGTMTLSGNVIVSGTLGADLIPDGDNTRDIGSASAEWKDIYIDGVAYLDAINFNGTAISATAAEINILDGVTASTSELNIMDGVTATTSELNIMDGVTATTAEVNLMDGGTSAGTTAVAGGDGIVTNDGGTMRQTTVDTFDTYLSQTTKTLTNKTLTTPVIEEIDSSSTITLDAGTDIILDADGGDVFLKDAGTTYGSLTNTSGNLIIKSGTTTAITFSGADATIAGDLTISGDDLTMGTNTAGHMLVGDGSNYNPVPISGDVTMASSGAVTIASGAVEGSMLDASVITGQTAETSVDTSNDLVLMHDNSASALRKITVGNLISSAGGLTDLASDSSPQLGGDLDAQGKDIEDVGLSSADSHVGIYGSSSSPVTLTVTVASKTAAHPYNGDGSSSAYFINGIESPALTLHGVDNVTSDSGYYYRFDQADSSNSGHPLRFYLDADKTTAYTTGVTTNGTPGSSGAYTQIDVDEDTPSILYYQCSSHGYMGNHAVVQGSNKINHSEALISFPTATGTLVGTGDTGSVSNGMLAGSIADSKLNTISTAGKVDLAALEIDGGTDIGAALADADLMIVDDGAGGTNRKMEASRIKTYVGAAAGAFSIDNLDIDGGTDIGADITDSDLFIIDDGAGGTNRKATMSRLSTYINASSTGASAGFAVAMAIAL